MKLFDKCLHDKWSSLKCGNCNEWKTTYYVILPDRTAAFLCKECISAIKMEYLL